MDSITLKSPAKLNLFLDVLHKRPDGYHDIETIFERIDLCDEIVLTKADKGINIACGNKDVPTDRTNLIHKAIKSLSVHLKKDINVNIILKKKIPVAAGLGGGSGNAAAALIGINRLFDLGLTNTQLMPLAEKIGADVPFFLLDEPFALGRGKGEDLEVLRTDLVLWHVIVRINLKISTKDIYSALDLGLTAHKPDVKIIHNSIINKDIAAISKQLYNRLEDVVFEKHREISDLKAVLKDSGLGKGVLLSGSGPAIFCITDNRQEAVGLKDRLASLAPFKKADYQVFVAKTL